MTGNEYLSSVLNKYTATSSEISDVKRIANSIAPALTTWAGDCLSKILFSGAYAKGTAVKGSSDIDLFISLKSSTTNPLGEIFQSLYKLSEKNGWKPRKQNVSIGINLNGYKIDLVPAKKQRDFHNWHSLYKNKTNSWTQGNISEHISTVQKSGRINEIKAIKIWRNLNSLNFPSFYLELTVIDALYGKRTNNPAANVLHTLNYIGQYFVNSRVLDPSNCNNILSNDLSKEEKSYIAQFAQHSASQKYWKDILW